VEGQLPWGAEEVLAVDDAKDDEDKAAESQMRSFSELFPHSILVPYRLLSFCMILVDLLE
jgi:hypothetical protein